MEGLQLRDATKPEEKIKRSNISNISFMSIHASVLEYNQRNMMVTVDTKKRKKIPQITLRGNRVYARLPLLAKEINYGLLNLHTFVMYWGM